MNKEIFLVGVHLTESFQYTWGVIGVFDNEQDAIRNCKDRNYFYAKLELNKAHHCEVKEFEYIIYPIKE